MFSSNVGANLVLLLLGKRQDETVDRDGQGTRQVGGGSSHEGHHPIMEALDGSLALYVEASI